MSGHLNCFLNVALQSMWAFPAVRMDIQTFGDQRNGGPEEIKPLINAIQDFFQTIDTRGNNDSKSYRRVHVFESIGIRRELFKLFYLNGEFTLNKTADAAEVLDCILTCMHTWAQTCCTPPDQLKIKKDHSAGKGIISELATISCDSKETQPCFIHDKYFIKHQQINKCSCGKKTGIIDLEKNMFSETVFMTQILEGLDAISNAVKQDHRSTYTTPSVVQSSLQKEKSIQAVNGKFFDAIKSQFRCELNSCVLPDQPKNVKHESYSINFLAAHPEVLTFNLNWDTDSPRASDILKTLISLPEVLDIKDLYTASQTQSQEYAFRGMICYTYGHYIAYFRRIFLKIGFLSGLDFNNINA